VSSAVIGGSRKSCSRNESPLRLARPRTGGPSRNRLGTALDWRSWQSLPSWNVLSCSRGVLRGPSFGIPCGEIDLWVLVWRIERQLLAWFRARCYVGGKERGARGVARRGTQRAGGGKGIRPRHVGYVAGFSFFRLPYFFFGGFRGAARPDAARRGDVVARGSRFARDAGAPPRRATRVIWSRWTSAGRRYKSFLRPLQFWITTEGIQ
jgi:hypothetical protein